MIRSEVGAAEIILLLVISEGFNTWSALGAGPFSDLKGLDKEKLHKQEITASVTTVSFGLLATIIIGNYAPLMVALLFSGALTLVYNHEWEKDNGHRD